MPYGCLDRCKIEIKIEIKDLFTFQAFNIVLSMHISKMKYLPYKKIYCIAVMFKLFSFVKYLQLEILLYIERTPFTNAHECLHRKLSA